MFKRTAVPLLSGTSWNWRRRHSSADDSYYQARSGSSSPTAIWLIMSVWSFCDILVASVHSYGIYINTSTVYTHKTLHKCHGTRPWHLTHYFMASHAPFFANFTCARFLQKRTLSHIQVDRICRHVSIFLRMYVSPCSSWVCLYAILLRVFARICACLCRIFPVVFNAHEYAWACMSVWFLRKILSLSVTKRAMPSKYCTTIVTTFCIRGKECMWTSYHSP
jgi:hypothetical protein